MDEQALMSAIFHYRAEVKNGKFYAKGILEGLELALKKLEKYNKLMKFLEVK